MKTVDVTCAECGATCIPHRSGCGTGYAMRPDGARICYTCSDALELKAMREGDRYFAYMSMNGAAITTWPGGVLGRVVSRGARHPWSRERRYLRIVDVYGASWTGTGAPGEYVRMRRTKAKK